MKALYDRGYKIDSPPLIRAYLAISTGVVKFREASPKLDIMKSHEFIQYLDRTEKAVVKVLDIMKEFGVRLSDLQSKYLPVIPSVAVHKKYNEPGRIIDDRFKRDLIKWLVYASFDKRYTGALERDLYQDISTLNEHSYEINHLPENLRTQNLSEGDLSGDREHLTLLSVLYTYNQARDWDIKADPTKISDIPDKELTVHHIFSYNSQTLP